MKIFPHRRLRGVEGHPAAVDIIYYPDYTKSLITILLTSAQLTSEVYSQMPKQIVSTMPTGGTGGEIATVVIIGEFESWPICLTSSRLEEAILLPLCLIIMSSLRVDRHHHIGTAY